MQQAGRSVSSACPWLLAKDPKALGLLLGLGAAGLLSASLATDLRTSTVWLKQVASNAGPTESYDPFGGVTTCHLPATAERSLDGAIPGTGPSLRAWPPERSHAIGVPLVGEFG